MLQACKWLEICRREHGKLCNTLGIGADGELLPLQPLDLLVIDLSKMGICDMPQGSEYLTLSYCRPAKSYLTLRRKTLAQLFEHGGLPNNMDNLGDTSSTSYELHYARVNSTPLYI
jgi:hypothetical protein